MITYYTGAKLNVFLVTLVKFANNTTVVGLISKNDESACRDEVKQLTDWCNNLSLNMSKTKEMIVDFWKPRSEELTATNLLCRSSSTPSFLEITQSLNTSSIAIKDK